MNEKIAFYISSRTVTLYLTVPPDTRQPIYMHNFLHELYTSHKSFSELARKFIAETDKARQNFAGSLRIRRYFLVRYSEQEYGPCEIASTLREEMREMEHESSKRVREKSRIRKQSGEEGLKCSKLASREVASALSAAVVSRGRERKGFPLQSWGLARLEGARPKSAIPIDTDYRLITSHHWNHPSNDPREIATFVLLEGPDICFDHRYGPSTELRRVSSTILIISHFETVQR